MLRYTCFFISLFTIVSSSQASTDWRNANQLMIDDQIIPSYKTFQAAANQLNASSKSFCEIPTREKLNTLYRDYENTMIAWAGVQHIRIGPVGDHLRYHRIQLWPDKRNITSRQLPTFLEAEDSSQLGMKKFYNVSVAIQSLAAMERMLFKEEDPLKTFFKNGKGNYRCALLHAIATNQASITKQVIDEWIVKATPKPYREELLTTGENELIYKYPSDKDVTAMLLNELSVALKVISEQKLKLPMGESQKHAKPKRAEAWRSQLSMKIIQENLTSAKRLYEIGFSPLLSTDESMRILNQSIHDEFDKSIEMAHSFELPFQQLLTNERDWNRLKSFDNQVRKLRALISGELPPALGLPLGFNSLDGD